MSAILPVKIYNDSYYSIVSETTAFNEYNQYTEKVAKPMLAKRLFVVFAGRHYLKNLKEKGFKTFDCIIDESYDSIEDPDIRFYQAWQQIEYLCTCHPDLVAFKIREIVEHNQYHFLNTNWHYEMRETFASYKN